MRKTKLAGLMPVHDYSKYDHLDAFHMMEALCDWTCVLDDNSRTPFQFAEDADEYLSLRRGNLWNDLGNRTMLMYRAYLAGHNGWALTMDSDMLPSRALFDWIQTLDLDTKHAHVCVPLRDVWDCGTKYRTDGVWGRKTFAVLQFNLFYLGMAREREHTKDTWPPTAVGPSTLRLHATPIPFQVATSKMFPPKEGCCLYHYGCLTWRDRNERVEKYHKEDRWNEFQKDYDYITDESGLTLADMPEEDAEFLKDWIVDRKLPVNKV